MHGRRHVDRSAQTQSHGAGGELVGDGSSVGQGAGEPVELGDHKRVPGPAGGERLTQPGPLPVGAGQAVVDVDPLRRHPHSAQRVALGGQVLGVGGATGVPDEQRAHGAPPWSAGPERSPGHRQQPQPLRPRYGIRDGKATEKLD